MNNLKTLEKLNTKGEKITMNNELVKGLVKELEKYEEKAEKTNDSEMRMYYLGKINGLQIALHYVISQNGGNNNE